MAILTVWSVIGRNGISRFSNREAGEPTNRDLVVDNYVLLSALAPDIECNSQQEHEALDGHLHVNAHGV